MKIHEYQAKQLLREAGVAVARGVVADAPRAAASARSRTSPPQASSRAPGAASASSRSRARSAAATPDLTVTSATNAAATRRPGEGGVGRDRATRRFRSGRMALWRGMWRICHPRSGL